MSSTTNHYAIDWRYMTLDAFLTDQLHRPGSLVWEYKSIKDALVRLLKPRRPVTYRFSSVIIPAKDPNPKPF
jgi:hypothetical protein